jgi:P27 family predicted phage terminase small subunit
MAGARQPIDLVIANGKKHLTKAEIEQRKAEEVRAPCECIEPPPYLQGAMAKEFVEYAEKLEKIGIISDLDVDCLARYILSKSMYLKLTSKLQNEVKEGRYAAAEKLLTMQDKSFKQCQSCASALGLTISSRCKLVVPKTDEGESALMKALSDNE